MRYALSAVSLSALLTIPALAQDLAGTTTRSSAPPEFLSNYSVNVIGLQQAINKGFTGAGTVIVVIDDGFDLTHPVFQGKVIEAINTSGGGGPVPLEDHGTHVAGIASGVAPNAKLAFYTFGNLAGVTDAFKAGAAKGAIVYNNSWGTDIDVNRVLFDPDFSTNPFRAMQNIEGTGAALWEGFVTAMRESQKTGVIVFSASNHPDRLPNDIDISAGLPLVFPELRNAWIAVVNVNQRGEVISVKCGSAAAFCLAAPGTDINSAMPGGGFGLQTGTSMAGPHVSGAVALAREMFPAATPAELTQLIFQTATDVGAPGVDSVFGWGVLNVGNIVRTIEPSTAGTFANASSSRFSALAHAGSAMRQRLSLPAATNAETVSGAPQSSYASFSASSTGGAVGLSNPIVSGMWVSPVLGYATIGSGPTSRGARSETAGVLVGVDLVSDAFLRFGIAGGYTQTRMSTRGSADSGKADAIHLGVYGSVSSDGWFLQGSGQVAFFNQTLTRHGISGTQGISNASAGRSSFRSTALEVDTQAGYTFELGDGSTLSPYANFNARWQEASSFRETGAGIFNLAGSSGSQSNFGFGPGVRWASAPIAVSDAALRVEADIAYTRLTGDLQNKTNVTLLGRQIQGRTAEVGRDVLRVGTRLNLTNEAETLSGFIGYSGSFQTRAVSHSASAGLQVNF